MTTPGERPEPSGAGPTPGAPTAAPPEAPTDQPTGTPTSAPQPPTIEERAEAFGKRAEAFGREAEVAAQRWSSSPAVKETADAAGRVWGLVLLAVGAWFLADITLGLTMPSIAWRDLWPLALIVLGGYIVLKGLMRRT